MPPLKLHIKNMVCHRCRLVVTDILEKLNLHPLHVSLGEIILAEESLSNDQSKKLADNLKAVGFALIDDRKSKMIEQIKAFVIDSVRQTDERSNLTLSDRIAKHLRHDYSALSNLFSQVEGMTIEQYTINQKIERVKELLTYDEMSLSQIAAEMGYSSTAHLSAQFKKYTGMTPSVFKKGGMQHRSPLDEIGKP